MGNRIPSTYDTPPPPIRVRQSSTTGQSLLDSPWGIPTASIGEGAGVMMITPSAGGRQAKGYTPMGGRIAFYEAMSPFQPPDDDEEGPNSGNSSTNEGETETMDTSEKPEEHKINAPAEQEDTYLNVSFQPKPQTISAPPVPDRSLKPARRSHEGPPPTPTPKLPPKSPVRGGVKGFVTPPDHLGKINVDRQASFVRRNAGSKPSTPVPKLLPKTTPRNVRSPVHTVLVGTPPRDGRLHQAHMVRDRLGSKSESEPTSVEDLKSPGGRAGEGPGLNYIEVEATTDPLTPRYPSSGGSPPDTPRQPTNHPSGDLTTWHYVEIDKKRTQGVEKTLRGTLERGVNTRGKPATLPRQPHHHDKSGVHLMH